MNKMFVKEITRLVYASIKASLYIYTRYSVESGIKTGKHRRSKGTLKDAAEGQVNARFSGQVREKPGEW